MPKPLVIQTEELEPGPATWLAERCELVVCPYKDTSRLDTLLPKAAGLIVRTYTKVNEAMLDKAPGLKVVARAGVALENIDVAECRRRGITVVHAPGANTRAVVEYVWAQILDAYRPMHYLAKALPPDEWHQTRNRYTAPRQLTDLTLGIWGFGRIGTAMARVAAAFEVRALYNDLIEIPVASRSGAEPVSVERMLRESDIVTVHIDYRPRNERLVNAAVLAQMKPDAVLINASRGFVADPAAIAAWCRANPGAQAFLDVHDPTEPIGPDYPALGIPNLHVAPHLASGTVTAKTNMSWVVRDVWRVLCGEKPEFEAPSL